MIAASAPGSAIGSPRRSRVPRHARSKRSRMLGLGERRGEPGRQDARTPAQISSLARPRM